MPELSRNTVDAMEVRIAIAYTINELASAQTASAATVTATMRVTSAVTITARRRYRSATTERNGASRPADTQRASTSRPSALAPPARYA